MKPEAAARPRESGYYWVKTAQRSWNHEDKSWTWNSPKVSAWEPVKYDARLDSIDEIGSDEGQKWAGDWFVVTAWLPLTPPEEVK